MGVGGGGGYVKVKQGGDFGGVRGVQEGVVGLHLLSVPINGLEGTVP